MSRIDDYMIDQRNKARNRPKTEVLKQWPGAVCRQTSFASCVIWHVFKAKLHDNITIGAGKTAFAAWYDAQKGLRK